MTSENCIFPETSRERLGASDGLGTSEVVATRSVRDLVDAARRFAGATRADSTKRAYRSSWTTFETWCRHSGLHPLPAAPATVVLYITHLATTGHKVATIGKSIVAVAQAHKFAGLDTPTAAAAVRETMRGIRRTLGVSQTQKTPLMSDSLRAIGQLLPDDLMGARDRALLFVGFGGAFRRAELVALDADNVCFTDDGLVITLEKSKTDQESHGRTVGIPFGSFPLTCPVRALKNWLKLSGIKEGPLFRSIGRWDQVGSSRLSDKMVANIVKKRVAAIGFDPTRFAGHSLRSGFASSAAKAGRSERSIMRQTGHRSTTMVRRYIRDASLFSDNPVAGLL